MKRTSIILTTLFLATLDASRVANASPSVSSGSDGRLAYTHDKQGNQIPDFSRCGYMGGGVAIPVVPVARELSPQAGQADDTARIQAAIDALSSVKPNEHGLRGTLLLKRGLYRVAGTLKVAASGVVIRGEGQTANDTILLAACRT